MTDIEMLLESDITFTDFSNQVQEDDVVKVFMDANPNADGHMLIVPKKHFEDFIELDDDTIKHIHNVAKQMKDLVYKKLDNIEGLVLVNNYG